MPKNKKGEHMCSETVFDRDGFPPHGCSRKGRFLTRSGKWYCSQHHPVNVSKRRAKSQEKWDAENKKEIEKYALLNACWNAKRAGLDPVAILTKEIKKAKGA